LVISCRRLVKANRARQEEIEKYICEVKITVVNATQQKNALENKNLLHDICKKLCKTKNVNCTSAAHP